MRFTHTERFHVARAGVTWIFSMNLERHSLSGQGQDFQCSPWLRHNLGLSSFAKLSPAAHLNKSPVRLQTIETSMPATGNNQSDVCLVFFE